MKFMRGVRIGLLGYPMEGMGDFAVDHTALLSQIGIKVRHLAMKAVAERAENAPADEIAKQIAEDRRNFQLQSDITQEEHEVSSRLEWALREMLRESELDGFASHFLAVGEENCLKAMPFLAASKLLAEGYGYGGEGDVTSAAAVAMMHALAGAANFTEMFTMDFAGNSILMMHMGEANWKMARKDEPVRLLRAAGAIVDLAVDPLLLAFSLEPGDCTLVSLTTGADGKLKSVVTEGQLVAFPYISDLWRPHYKFKPDGDLEEFLTRFSLEGGSHHQAMVYGRWSGTVQKVAMLLGIEFARV